MTSFDHDPIFAGVCWKILRDLLGFRQNRSQNRDFIFATAKTRSSCPSAVECGWLGCYTQMVGLSGGSVFGLVWFGLGCLFEWFNGFFRFL